MISNNILSRLEQQEDAYQNKDYNRMLVLEGIRTNLTDEFSKKWSKLEPELNKLDLTKFT